MAVRSLMINKYVKLLTMLPLTPASIVTSHVATRLHGKGKWKIQSIWQKEQYHFFLFFFLPFFFSFPFVKFLRPFYFPLSSLSCFFSLFHCVLPILPNIAFSYVKCLHCAQNIEIKTSQSVHVHFSLARGFWFEILFTSEKFQ